MGQQGIKAGLERAQSVKYLLHKQEDLNLGPQHLWKSPQTHTLQYTHIRTSHEESRILSQTSLNEICQGLPKLCFPKPHCCVHQGTQSPSIQLNHPVEAQVHSLSFFRTFHLSPIFNDVLHHGRVD